METITRKELFQNMVDDACKGADRLMSGVTDGLGMLEAQGYFMHAFEETMKEVERNPLARELVEGNGDAIRTIERKADEVMKEAYMDRDYRSVPQTYEHFRACANCRKMRDWVCGVINRHFKAVHGATCFETMHGIYNADFVFGIGGENHDGVPVEG